MGIKRGPYSHRGALACIICFYMWYVWNKETFLGARGDDCWQVCFTEKDIETVIYYNKDMDYGKYLSKQWNVGLLEEFKEWEEKKHKTFIKCCNGNRKEDSRKKIHNKVIWGRYRLHWNYEDMTKSYCQIEIMRMNQTVSDYVHMHKQIEKHKADSEQINNPG